ncbi:winged helix-turn-helix transcriptional regulator [Shouchella clausii]|uniref:winged helix-turn-helix transcriptional regulator n=1 Tax=Shouchella clausii TaxID=79880 RepID=UPI000798ECCA|nr:helix-turn-helix domain-containing protein [Shouchella clausii]AST98561.1 transcriptional regulator [Shouchella clausii]KKI86738.1 HxlR family transcriptional regulator [Shouchella clausii]MCR1288976.1 helix-turn-helix transcriptional regulator [Shouchella clausii]MEB5472163.1 helix-turn-helix domain-containing protein [Shouchella clausii]MED4160029.1 helix-turn-helix domain-containing protein [Shouchella clausii]
MKERYKLPCNIAQTLNLVGDRWTLLILHEIMLGQSTFNDIKNHLEGISAKLLSDRLKYLEEVDLITSNLYSSHPPRYEYVLTEAGDDLEPVFYSLLLWGRKHLDRCYKKLVHTECGADIDMLYYCPSCQKTVQKDEMHTEAVD